MKLHLLAKVPTSSSVVIINMIDSIANKRLLDDDTKKE